MHLEKANQGYSKQPKNLGSFDNPKATETFKSASDSKFPSEIQAFDKVDCLGPIKGSESASVSGTSRGISDPEKHFAQSAAELLSLLRYTAVLHHGVVERWSRKVREIDIAYPQRGIAVLDELLTDYWSVFVAFKSDQKLSVEVSLDRPNFATEMRQMKTKFDSLEKILLSVRD